MNPEVFPTQELEELYFELEESGHSKLAKFKKLLKFNLVCQYDHDGQTYYFHPNHPWKTYMFRIPIYSSARAQERTTRSKFIAFKEVVTVWIMGVPANLKIDEAFYLEVRYWFAKHMTGYATLAIPEYFAKDFERDFKRTQSELICITPNLNRAQCPKCSHLFVVEKDDETLQCPDCTFTFIKD